MNRFSSRRRSAAQKRWRQVRRRGAMLILISLLLVLFLACAAFSVDVAYMELVNAELRASTDAAAKAAVTALNVTNGLATARQAAKDVAAANRVAGQPLVIEDRDIVFGRVEFSAQGPAVFRPGATPFAAARVSGRKVEGAPSGNVPLFFGGILGKSAFDTEVAATAARPEVDICLVLDRSGSMSKQSKLEAIKSSVAVFLDALNDIALQTQIGLVSFSTRPTVDRELTSDFSLVRQAAGNLQAQGMTDIGSGIDAGTTVLLADPSRQFNQKIMVVVTDGYQFVDESVEPLDPDVATARAKTQGIVIHTMTLGLDADETLMAQIAATTGGSFRRAPAVEALPQAFQHVAQTIITTRTVVTLLTQ